MAKDTLRQGKSHPSTLGDRHHLALIFRAAGRLEDAEAELRGVLEAQGELTSNAHPRRYLRHFDHARILVELGFTEQARQALANIPTVVATRLGADHWLVGAAEITEAEIDLAEGRPDLALGHADHAMAILGARQVGRERWRFGEAQSAYGEALSRLGRREEGQKQLQAAASSLHELRGPSSPSATLAQARLRSTGRR